MVWRVCVLVLLMGLCSCADHDEAAPPAPLELTIDAIYLALELTDEIDVDQPLACELQGVLDRARTVSSRLEDLHHTPDYYFGYLTVGVTAEPADSWRAGSLLSGDDGLDGLLVEHLLDDVVETSWGTDTFVLHFTLPIDAPRLEDELVPLAAVRFADPRGIEGGGDEIAATRLSDGWEIVFSRGWGDCLTRCPRQHHFAVLVPDDEQAVLVQQWGDPLSDDPNLDPTWGDRAAESLPLPFNCPSP